MTFISSRVVHNRLAYIWAIIHYHANAACMYWFSRLAASSRQPSLLENFTQNFQEWMYIYFRYQIHFRWQISLQFFRNVYPHLERLGT